MPKFSLGCLDARSTSPTRLLSDDDGDGAIRPGCIFCNVSREDGFDIVHEDAELIAFRDRSPQADTHLLIIPRYHLVSTVRQLTPSHLPLLNRMTALAHRLSSPSDPHPRPHPRPRPHPPKLGYHIPPFSSVHHLHLHVLIGKPTLLGRVKYPVRSHGSKGEGKEQGDDSKGWSWFVTPEQVEGILLRGGRVGLGRG